MSARPPVGESNPNDDPLLGGLVEGIGVLGLAVGVEFELQILAVGWDLPQDGE